MIITIDKNNKIAVLTDGFYMMYILLVVIDYCW